MFPLDLPAVASRRAGERTSSVIGLRLPDGRYLEVGHDQLWDLTSRLVAEDHHLASAVSTAADLRLQLKILGKEGEIALNERQARALLAVS